MTLAEIRELCDLAKRPYDPNSPVSCQVRAANQSVWQGYLLDHGEELLAVAEAAADAVDHSLAPSEYIEAVDKALLALEGDE